MHVIDAQNKVLSFGLTDDELNDLLALNSQSLSKMEDFLKNYINNENAERRQDIIQRIAKRLEKVDLVDLIEIKKIVDKNLKGGLWQLMNKC